MFNTATKIDAVNVGYKGTSPAEAALVAGQVRICLVCEGAKEAGQW